MLNTPLTRVLIVTTSLLATSIDTYGQSFTFLRQPIDVNPDDDAFAFVTANAQARNDNDNPPTTQVVEDWSPPELDEVFAVQAAGASATRTNSRADAFGSVSATILPYPIAVALHTYSPQTGSSLIVGASFVGDVGPPFAGGRGGAHGTVYADAAYEVRGYDCDEDDIVDLQDGLLESFAFATTLGGEVVGDGLGGERVTVSAEANAPASFASVFGDFWGDTYWVEGGADNDTCQDDGEWTYVNALLPLGAGLLMHGTQRVSDGNVVGHGSLVNGIVGTTNTAYSTGYQGIGGAVGTTWFFANACDTCPDPSDTVVKIRIRLVPPPLPDYRAIHDLTIGANTVTPVDDTYGSSGVPPEALPYGRLASGTNDWHQADEFIQLSGASGNACSSTGIDSSTSGSLFAFSSTSSVCDAAPTAPSPKVSSMSFFDTVWVVDPDNLHPTITHVTIKSNLSVVANSANADFTTVRGRHGRASVGHSSLSVYAWGASDEYLVYIEQQTSTADDPTSPPIINSYYLPDGAFESISATEYVTKSSLVSADVRAGYAATFAVPTEAGSMYMATMASFSVEGVEP